MTIRTGFAEGELCWTDVQTRDVEAAKAFYAAVFGWRYEDLPTPDGRSYAQAFLGDDLGDGARAAEPPAGIRGRPAQWNVYFAVDDARDLADEADPFRRPVEFGPEEIGDTGVMVFLDPPGGGTTGVWQAGTHSGRAEHNEPGALTWAELLTPEPQAAVGFFQQLFGHEVTEYPQDDGGTYTTLMVDGTEVAGIARVARRVRRTPSSPGWQVYFGVSDVAEAVRAAVAAGGVVLIEPEDGEEAGTIATLKDPQGGVFSVLEV